MSNTENEWLQAAIQGNDEAFTQLVETYQKPVYNLCYRMLGDPLEAEDAAQESFWRAYQALKRYDPQRSFITWLLSIAAHYCIDQQRRKRLPVVPVEILPEEAVPRWSTQPGTGGVAEVGRPPVACFIGRTTRAGSRCGRSALLVRFFG